MMIILSVWLSLTLYQDIGYEYAKERATAFRDVAARAFTDGYVGYVPGSVIYDSYLEEDRTPRTYRIRFPDGVVRVSSTSGQVVESTIRVRPYPNDTWGTTRAKSVLELATTASRYHAAAGYENVLKVLCAEVHFVPGVCAYRQVIVSPTIWDVPFHAEHMVVFNMRYDTGMLESFIVRSCPTLPQDLISTYGATEATMKMLYCLRGKVTSAPGRELYEVQLGIRKPHDAIGNLVQMNQRYVEMGQLGDGLLVCWGAVVGDLYPMAAAFSCAFYACVDAKTGELIFAEVLSGLIGATRNDQAPRTRWNLGEGPITVYLAGKKPISVRQADVEAVSGPTKRSKAGIKLDLQRGRLFLRAEYHQRAGLLRMEGANRYGRPNRA